MPRFPRYTTFSPEERIRVLGVPAETPATPSARRKPLREFTGPVTYPDAVGGSSHYRRGGPRWHILTYRYPWRGQEEFLTRLYHNGPLDRDVVAMGQLIQEKAIVAYQLAMRQERKDWFLRATPPHGRKVGPPWPMSARRARELAGRFAVCYQVPVTPARYLPLLGSFDTIEDANATWREKGDLKCVVARCARWTAGGGSSTGVAGVYRTLESTPALDGAGTLYLGAQNTVCAIK